jgi:hypothetical protein
MCYHNKTKAKGLYKVGVNLKPRLAPLWNWFELYYRLPKPENIENIPLISRASHRNGIGTARIIDAATKMSISPMNSKIKPIRKLPRKDEMDLKK